MSKLCGTVSVLIFLTDELNSLVIFGFLLDGTFKDTARVVDTIFSFFAFGETLGTDVDTSSASSLIGIGSSIIASRSSGALERSSGSPFRIFDGTSLSNPDNIPNVSVKLGLIPSASGNLSLSIVLAEGATRLQDPFEGDSSGSVFVASTEKGK